MLVHLNDAVDASWPPSPIKDMNGKKAITFAAQSQAPLHAGTTIGANSIPKS
jgi:hypothetical protein